MVASDTTLNHMTQAVFRERELLQVLVGSWLRNSGEAPQNKSYRELNQTAGTKSSVY
jgi:hypothetical protein